MTLLPALQQVIGGFIRRTWLVTLVAVMACAFFAARAVAAYVEADHLISDPAPTRPMAKPPAPPKPTKPAPLDPSIISERNIFCSTCVPEVHGNASAYTGQPAILIATSVGEKPRATVRVTSTEAQGSWGIDDTIPGVGKIERIGYSSIDVVDGAGNPRTLSLLDTTNPAGPGSGAATPEPGPAKAKPFEGRVKKLSDGSFEVDRDVVRELVAMGGGKDTGVRAFPIMSKGEITGLRLAGVKPTSIAAALELRSSDILTAIDGEQIKTMQQLLDLYGKLDKLNGIELQGTRAGKPLAVNLRFK